MDQDLNTYLRPAVAKFALEMENRLREKDAKYGGNSWETLDSALGLILPATNKFRLLIQSVIMKGPDVLKFAVDTANYLMMLLDVIRRIRG